MNSRSDLFRLAAVDALSVKPWLALLRAPGVGPATVQRLLDAFGSAAMALSAGPAALRGLGLNDEQLRSLATPDWSGVDRDLEWLAGAGRSFVAFDDPRYPPLLRDIPQPPIGLFCQGDADLLRLPQIALVGARSATPQGLENARGFASELSRRGLVVTSGLALGIDGAAHRGALEGSGLTIAVCATGLDRVYPARHRELAHRIAEQGLLISEFPVGVQALAENFPRRNRIISGLAMGVLVVEAARESGSLITARQAGEQGREVFAIPGSIHNPMSRGCHALIRQGAKLVESVDDILEEIAPQLALRRQAADGSAGVGDASPGSADPAARQLLECLDDGALDIDRLAERSGLGLDRLHPLLLTLELSGEVVSLPGGGYQRLRPA